MLSIISNELAITPRKAPTPRIMIRIAIIFPFPVMG